MVVTFTFNNEREISKRFGKSEPWENKMGKNHKQMDNNQVAPFGGTIDVNVPIQAALLARSNKYHLLAQLEAGGFLEFPHFPTLILMAKVWDEMKRIMGYVGISSYHPIWEKGSLVELGKLQGFSEWFSQGIQFFH